MWAKRKSRPARRYQYKNACSNVRNISYNSLLPSVSVCIVIECKDTPSLVTSTKLVREIIMRINKLLSYVVGFLALTFGFSAAYALNKGDVQITNNSDSSVPAVSFQLHTNSGAQTSKSQRLKPEQSVTWDKREMKKLAHQPIVWISFDCGDQRCWGSSAEGNFNYDPTKSYHLSCKITYYYTNPFGISCKEITP